MDIKILIGLNTIGSKGVKKHITYIIFFRTVIYDLYLILIKYLTYHFEILVEKNYLGRTKNNTKK